LISDWNQMDFCKYPGKNLNPALFLPERIQ